MRPRHRDGFTTIRTEGAILPRDLLARIAALDKDLGGLAPDDYHLSGEKLGEATNRSWNRLQGAWAAFRGETGTLRDGDPGTTPTREKWLLPLFQELGYGRLPTAKAQEIEGRSYAVSHGWGHVPIHLVGLNVDLDRRTPGVAGAAQASPHSLLQEFLNRSDEHLWGFVSNGLSLRILRDNRSLTRQAFVEFDLEAMMTGEAYADFALLYLLCHQSRVEAERPEECRLERWSRAAEAQGTRALDQLRKGVEETINALGTGFIAHPGNTELRQKLQDGTLSTQDYYRDLLRLVYRLLFVFVAEDRGLLLDPGASPEAKALYTRFYSTARLRRLAERRRGSRHADLYQGLRLVLGRLGDDRGCPELALPALGSFLFSDEGAAALGSLEIANRDLLAAVRGLAFTTEGNVRRAIDYRNLGSEELGSVYEALLELHPEVNVPARTFALASAGGSERKTTGSYYTPSSLIQCLLDSALDPVVADALRAPDPEAALLALRVCDPACGSGHFLVAAAHRLAKRLAAARTGDEEPSPEAQRASLRDVIGHCLYGVDLNPMAVELCKVSLWMEALEPGRPLSFLDHRILCGNSLLGATPALLAAGVPDDAFKAIEGDDKQVVSALRKQNKQERAGQTTLFAGTLPALDTTALSETVAGIDHLADDSLAGVRAKEERYRGLAASSEFRRAKLAADAWCAAFVCRKSPDAPPAVTHDVFLRLVENPGSVPIAIRDEVERLADEYRLFHWHLAFPDVFRTPGRDARAENEQARWSGGFDLVLGNPPWLSFTGRQKVTLPPAETTLLNYLFPPIVRWPASHSAFLLLATALVRPCGGVGVVLPLQVSHLDAYGPTRQAIDRSTNGLLSVVDAGEDAFLGVNQPVGLYTGSIDRHASTSSAESHWVTKRAPWRAVSARVSAGEGIVVGDDRGLGGMLARLAVLPRFPKESFSDPGVHTGNVSSLVVRDTPSEPISAWARVREGRDIEAFLCGGARKWLSTNPVLSGDQYCRIRSLEVYTATPILVRQTANRPIAALHRSPTYFRNSLLACNGVPGVPSGIVVALLNSTLFGFLHRSQFTDSNQKIFPQVKVKHLRDLPLFQRSDLEREITLPDGFTSAIGPALGRVSADIEAAKAAGQTALVPALEWTINCLVLDLYSVNRELLPALQTSLP